MFICQNKWEKFKITWETCRIKMACLILFLNRREGREGEKRSQRRREGKEEEDKREEEGEGGIAIQILRLLP